MDPIVILAISISISLKSCFMLHVKVIKTEKIFVPFTSTILILSWGIFSSIKRICSMVSFFVPSLGLFNILYHHRAEQVPFSKWQIHGKIQTDKIVLYGLEETVLWGDLDRWDYSNDSGGQPPHYTEYTGTSLGTTFILFLILTGAHFLFILVIKLIYSRKFFTRGDFLNKILHIIQNLNMSFPFEDWDQGKFTVKEYKERHHQTNIEMAWSLLVNHFFSLVMLVPLWYTRYKIRSRHLFLRMLIGTKLEEDQSFDNINNLLIIITSTIVFSCLMETFLYFLYNQQVGSDTKQNCNRRSRFMSPVQVQSESVRESLRISENNKDLDQDQGIAL